MECKKVRYKDKGEAQERLNKIRKISNRNKKPLRAYYCPNCGEYHLTSITKATQKVILQRNSLETRIERIAEEFIKKNKWYDNSN